MSFLNFSELLSFDEDQLTREIIQVKKQLFDLRLKKATRQSFKPHLFKHNRRKVAQLLTLESQKKQSKK
uniref:Large ribosomal subunit protein uL29c n=1 Tax=Cryptomonas curvata TaxID=233186 RepID=A0A222AHH2_9CRYP|nr:ribosomal protein L29 [Cryptomonas curvata]ASO75819.1 ribosomal protein L29 [Cryptomonas curvata]